MKKTEWIKKRNDMLRDMVESGPVKVKIYLKYYRTENMEEWEKVDKKFRVYRKRYYRKVMLSRWCAITGAIIGGFSGIWLGLYLLKLILVRFAG